MFDNQNRHFVEIFGEQNLEDYGSQSKIIELREEKLEELTDLRNRASEVFKAHLTITDLIVASAAGILLGLGNALFKGFVPQHGKLQHKHGTTRTAVDYKTPKPSGYKGSVQNLHRQIGPGHDIFRFKEALSLMSGESNDFNLWGKKATKILGHALTPGNMKLDKFFELGGFKIPSDPKSELINHLVIDFFTKTSLPIPGTSYIADHSEESAKVMLRMYDEGFNLKSAIGNSMAFALVQLIIHSYTFLFKAIPNSGFGFENFDLAHFQNIFKEYKKLVKENQFHMMMIIAHGASFLVDTIITTTSKSYAGLFQLNYASLLAFSKHLIQYILKSTKEYKHLIEGSKNKANEVGKLDGMWYSNFKRNFIKVTSNEHFVELFDPSEMIRGHKDVLRVADNLLKSQKQKQLLLEELRK